MKNINKHIYLGKNPQETLERSALSLLQMLGSTNLSLSDICDEIKARVCQAAETNTFFPLEVRNKEKKDKKETYYLFRTGFRFHNYEEPIYGYTQLNTNPHVRQPYYNLHFLREDLLRGAQFGAPHIADIYFEDLSALNGFLTKLADAALWEDWDYRHETSLIQHPVLKNYLEYSFYQAMLEGKLYRNDKEQKACLNTGLLDPRFNELYLVFDIEPVIPADGLLKERYVCPRIMSPGNRLFNHYVLQPPKAATFYRDRSQLVFACDHARNIDLNDRHIFLDNLERINNSLPADMVPYTQETIERCSGMFKQGLEHSLALAKQNYKLVAPQYMPETGNIQFLMPIYLSNTCEATCGGRREMASPNVALCLEPDGNGRYVGTTILTLDQAYNNIRLIAKPDSFWTQTRHLPCAPAAVQEHIEEEAPAATALFRYEKTLYSASNGRAFAFTGTLDTAAEDRAILHISNMLDGYVSAEALLQLEERCQAGPMPVRLLDKDERGWRVSLKGTTPAPLDAPTQPDMSEDNCYVMEQVEATIRGGLRGVLRGSGLPVALAPTHVRAKGLDTQDPASSLPVHLTRWDENAGVYNAVLYSMCDPYVA